MNEQITNYELRMTNFGRTAFVAVFFCAFCVSAGNSFAQNLSDSEIALQAERLNSRDAETRRDALHRLRLAESENAARIAAKGLNDKSEIVRSTAPFSVLAMPSDEAAARLLPHLKDKSEYVRRETAYALGKTGSLGATRALLEILEKDKKYSVKCSAAVALGEIGDVAAVGALTKILQRQPKEDEDFLRRAAARSIGQIAEITLRKEFLAQSEIKDFNAFVLENRKTLSVRFPVLSNALGVLIQTLQNPKEADDVKRETAFALGAIGDARALSVLQTRLNAEDYYLAEISREAVRKILNPQ